MFHNRPKMQRAVSRCQWLCLSAQVSMLTRQATSSQQQTQELFVYDVQTGTISICSFGDEGVSRCPQQHFWDTEHPLLLACELAKSGNAQKKRTGANTEGVGLEVAMLFATPQGIVLQECQPTQACQVLLQVLYLSSTCIHYEHLPCSHTTLHGLCSLTIAMGSERAMPLRARLCHESETT